MDETRPIIIKRKSAGGGDGHHGGAWKVAYADFVTAMMAFFLLMWLLNATSEDQRKGLADFFDPSLPISRVSAGGAGMLGGDTVFKPPEAAGSRDEGIRAKPTHKEDGEDLGDKTASPDDPEGETAPNTRPKQVAENEADAPSAAAAAWAAEGGIGEAEELVEDLLAKVREADGDGLLQHFSMRTTPEGLVIEIVDIQDDPLFASGAAEPQPVLEILADILVPVLNRTTNDIAVVGHTDSVPFNGRPNYTNWELSTDRANAARRVLATRGLPSERVVRVSGKAATDPIVEDPTAPKNRRIAITLLRQ